MAHSYLEYLRLKSIITALRVFDGEKPAPPSPDDSFTFKSQDGQREVKVNICEWDASRDLPLLTSESRQAADYVA